MREWSVVELRKFVTPEVIFGVGARRLAGRCCNNLGARHALVVSDPGVMTAGWTSEVAASLEEAEVAWSLYSGVSPNPRAEEVMVGAELYREKGCDVIVAVGGGSPIDCAKGIGIVSSNHRHILEFVGADRIGVPMPPVICVPTTNSSADVSQFAIITDLVLRTKAAIISKAVVPDVALIDPLTLTTMDPHLTACTGMDTLVHGIEAFLSSGNSPLTDLHALDCIRLVIQGLPACLRNPDDVEARSRMMLASLEAGVAFSNASLGAAHAMAHSVGGAFNIPHGECTVTLIRHVLAFNFAVAAPRFDRIGEAMGLDLGGLDAGATCARLVAAVAEFQAEIGLSFTLGHLGVRRDDIPALARNALEDVCMVTNPRRATLRDVEAMYEEAL
jgi:alcohol dehydrogenase class IV